MVELGIHELNIGLTRLVADRKLVLPPSYAAEAVIGLKSREEIKSALEEFLDAYNTSSLDRPLPALEEWASKGNGNIKWEDLESRVRKNSEGMAHLLNANLVNQLRLSGGGVYTFEIRRRGDARKNDRKRTVKVVLDSEHKISDFHCSCPTFITNFIKGNFVNETQFVTHMGCYHISGALTVSNLLPYDLVDNMDLALESLAMKVYKKQRSFFRDMFLLEHDIIKPDVLRRNGLKLEVFWNRRNIESNAGVIINSLAKYFENERGYKFGGFALEFPQTPYQTTSLAFDREDGNGRSVNILYDEVLSNLPFYMLKVPESVWIDELRAEPTGEFNENPLKSARDALYFKYFDLRTGSDMIARVVAPMSPIISSAYKREYDRILNTIP